MDILKIRALTLFIVAFLNVILASVLWYNSKKDKTRLWFGLLAFFSGLYAFFCGANYFFWGSSIDLAMFWYRTTWLGILMLPCFVAFSHYFTNNTKYLKFKVAIIYIAAFIIIYLVFTTDLFVKSVRREGINIASVNGPLDIVGRLYILFCLVVSTYNLLKDYFKAVGYRKVQLNYFILGASIYFLSGVISTSILPFIIKESPYYDIAAYFSLFWVWLTSYAILRYKLLDIRVIISELFVFVLCVALLLKIFSSNGLTEILINSFIFGIFIIFGALLIRSVYMEVIQREKMAEMAEEVKKSYEVEKKANEELKLLDNVKNQFLMQTQHDLRTPLTTIRGYCDLLIGGTLGKQTKKTLDVVERIEAVALTKLQDVNNFLDVAQFRLGKGAINVEPGVNIMLLLDDIQNTLKLKYEQKGLYLNIEKPSQEITISADKEKLKAAIFNIIDNAIKYTEKGGINIKLKTENEKLKITIADTGIGIPAEKVKTIFEDKFERTEQAKKVAEGRGVGLYLSGQIIKFHNGKAWAESEGEGKGSIFYIELPI